MRSAPMGMSREALADLLNNQNPTGGRKLTKPLDRVGKTYGDGSMVVGAGPWWSIRRSSAGKHLDSETQRRVERLLAYKTPQQIALQRRAKQTLARIDALQPELDRMRERAKSERQADIARRMQRLGLAPDALSAVIRERIAAQPRDYHRHLRTFYNGWAAFNAAYFGNHLALPDFHVEQLAPGVLADCATFSQPTVIRFAPRTIADFGIDEILDVLLHEMVHQSIGERHGHEICWGNAQVEGHHAEFARICNNIGRQRGWVDCSADITEGHQAARFWPPNKDRYLMDGYWRHDN